MTFIVEPDLVRWDHYGASSNGYAYWELYWGQTLYLRHDLVVKFPTNVIIDSYSDRDFRMRRKVSNMRSKHDSDTLVI